MAGDWIKMECSTPDKPEVLAITVKMGWDDPDLTVGKLFKLWRWFDQHTAEGNALGVTPALLDRYLGVSGFVEALTHVGWIVVGEAGVALPNFDRHNGASAKKRAQTAKRVANHKSNAGGNADSVSESVSGALPREEKRREERETETNAAPDGFAEFYQAYPKKVGKPAAQKAFRAAKVNGHLPDLLADINRRLSSGEWSLDKHQFIPNPATYLNQRRWEDEQPQQVSALLPGAL